MFNGVFGYIPTANIAFYAKIHNFLSHDDILASTSVA